MKKTALHEAHEALGARLVEFAGWEMPIQYPTGINQEHMAVRQDVGMFDVSHMGQIRIMGDDAEAFLGFVSLNDPKKLRVGRGQYSMLANDEGGLIDDIYLYKDAEQNYLMVSNAANHAKVLAHLRGLTEPYNIGLVDESPNWALMAIQGPGSALLLSRHVELDLTQVKKNRSVTTELSACPVKLARTGYTGEDGFELFCHPTDAVIIWDILKNDGAVPCGLGARDTLRLEAGFPLYGHEFDGGTNPLCSDYAWVVKDKDFYGRDAIWGKPCQQRLVALKLVRRGIARQGYKLFMGEREVGTITSGTISPLTRESIAMAWVDAEYAREGETLAVEIRGQKIAAVVTKPPFYYS